MARSLYPGHLPTTTFQRVVAAAASAVAAFADPKRADMVAALGEVTGRRALARIRAAMVATEDGRRLLRERPTVSKATGASAARLLEECAPGTFGAAYGVFLTRHGFDADDRAPVALVDDEELAYILLRYRQCHDYWHVLSGLPPTVFGEVALKWFELAHTGLPVAAISGLVGPALLTRAQRADLVQNFLPWALREGARATPLLAVDYDRLYHTDLDHVRETLRVQPAPTPAAAADGPRHGASPPLPS